MKLTDADNAADGIFFPALEQNMMGAVLINENDEVMFFNPAAEKLWGYKREEVIGNNIDMLIPRDLRPAHPEYIRHNREGGKDPLSRYSGIFLFPPPTRRRNSRLDEQRVTAENLTNSSRPHSRVFI